MIQDMNENELNVETLKNQILFDFVSGKDGIIADFKAETEKIDEKFRQEFNAIKQTLKGEGYRQARIDLEKLWREEAQWLSKEKYSEFNSLKTKTEAKLNAIGVQELMTNYYTMDDLPFDPAFTVTDHSVKRLIINTAKKIRGKDEIFEK
jgi:hypothetical protein